MSIYLLAKKARNNQMQKARAHKAPFSLFYTNMSSSCQALPRIPTRQKSYNQYQQKKIKQYVEPRVGFKRMPNFSSSQYIDNKKSNQIQRCPQIPCEKGTVSYGIHTGFNLSVEAEDIFPRSYFGETFEEALAAAKKKLINERAKGIMWVGFYTFGGNQFSQENVSSFSFSKNATLISAASSYTSYIYHIDAPKISSCCSSSSRLKPIITKDLLFKDASSQIEKKKAARNCCNDEPYETPVLANTICRPVG